MLCHSPQCYLCLLRLAPALLLLFGLELFVQSHFLVLCCDLNTITRLDKNSGDVFWISICINRLDEQMPSLKQTVIIIYQAVVAEWSRRLCMFNHALK